MPGLWVYFVAVLPLGTRATRRPQSLNLANGWLPLALLGIPGALSVGALYALWIRVSERPLYDLELVKEKLNRPAARVDLSAGGAGLGGRDSVTFTPRRLKCVWSATTGER